MPFSAAPSLRPNTEAIATTLSGWAELLHSELPDDARAWWQSALAPDAARLSLRFARAGRKLGFESLTGQEAPACPLPQASLSWPACDFGRVVLLCQESEGQSAAQCEHMLRERFAKGDNRERIAVLRCLPWLKHPQSGLELAIDACRSHVQDVFEAIACENRYAASYFPDANFNQMVLKAFFTDVAAQRIYGLSQRQSADLKRMALAYASERKAAGRSIPADLDLATQPES